MTAAATITNVAGECDLHASEQKNSYTRKRIKAVEDAKSAHVDVARADLLATSEGQRRVTRLQSGAIEATDTRHLYDGDAYLRFVPEGGCFGHGVMTTVAFDKGAQIGLYKGTSMDEKQKNAAVKKGNDVIIQMTTDKATKHRYINPKHVKSNVVKYINHGCHDCEANCAVGFAGDGDVSLCTMKPIKQFGFLRWDYRMAEPYPDWLRAYWERHDQVGKCKGQSRQSNK